jgi:hypothetical protein
MVYSVLMQIVVSQDPLDLVVLYWVGVVGKKDWLVIVTKIKQSCGVMVSLIRIGLPV